MPKPERRVLEWRAAASADLLATIDYTSEDNPDVAQRLKDNIAERVGVNAIADSLDIRNISGYMKSVR